VLPLLFTALILSARPQQQATQQLCGTVVEIACNSRLPLLMTLLVQPGISAKVSAPTPLDAARIRADVSVSRERRVCVTGVLAQKQSITAPANFVVRAAADIVPQPGDPDDWPTADVYTVCDRDVQPVNAKSYSRPAYTQDAMKAQIQGAAVVQAIVGVTGQVERVRLVKSLDAEHGLDEEALKAARQWTFMPATRDGAPVRMQVTLELTFTLRK
jgi:protein TonB